MSEKSRLVLIFASVVLLRWCVTYHPYSGQGKSPMFGDYEAQRHWQEITFNLPYEEWYTNSTRNDLQYWGLDYPPLTAYHSLLIARVANEINPDFVKIHSSRGYECENHKFFMRITVLIADILTFIPAVFWFVSKLNIAESTKLKNSDLNILGLTKRDATLISILIYPGLILIDHGHFQYNCVSLGFFVAAVAAIMQKKDVLASFLFTSALNYKQMELYHSLPFFFYILGNNISFKNRSLSIRWSKILYVASIVIITFTLIWIPFIGNRATFSDVVFRLFPIARGIFEDKVANVWCSLNVLYKLRDTFTNVALAKVCLGATLIMLIPCNLNLFFNPTSEKLVLSLINTSLAFFLFSFQVHEKSILLVAIPVAMYLHEDPLPCFWFLIISNFSMLPLYIKDDLLIAYGALTTFYVISVYLMFPEIGCVGTKKNASAIKEHKSRISKSKLLPSLMSFETEQIHHLINWSFCISMLGTFLLNVAVLFIKPPHKYPDLFPVLISTYSCGHFLLFFFYFNYKQFTNSDVKKKVKSM